MRRGALSLLCRSLSPVLGGGAPRAPPALAPFAATGAQEIRQLTTASAAASAATPAKAAKQPQLKAPPTAYASYFQQVYPAIKQKAGASAAFADVSRTVAAQWKSLPAGDKKKLQHAAEVAKAEYLKLQGSDAPKRAKKAKKAPSAYNLFVREELARKSAAKIGDAAKAWKTASAATKESYQKKAAAAKA